MPKQSRPQDTLIWADDGFNLCDPTSYRGIFLPKAKKMICMFHANHFHIDYNTSKFFPNAFLNSLPQSIE